PKCPVDAISSVRDRIVVDPQRCDGCGKCFKACPEVAFRLTDDLKAVLWVLASGGQVSESLDQAFAEALPGVDGDRITEAARLLLSWESRETKKSHDSMQNPIIAYSIEMGKVLQVATKVAQVTSTVMILGESGVGKEVVARFVHNASLRRGGPFVTINCGAIPPNLLESELFGYEAGAFTGAKRQGKPGMIETASSGTLFLDEISDLPLDLQVKLLQVIQERRLTRVGGIQPIEVDIRIIAATNRDLAKMVERGEFRADLFYRLNVVPIVIPPLRSRRDDIIPLIYHFLAKHNNTHRYNKTISRETREVLTQYSWPGNVRELENLIERLVVTVEGDEIGVEDLPQYIKERDVSCNSKVIVEGVIPLREAVEEVERQLIKHAQEEHETTYEIAEALGVNQSTVVRKLKKYAN
ncbi:MAG TPA: sigma 54-interacting transcriptional regulator, partial [Firmicutes bacterium]|nr:sigma 54-interacting transcriptional regulator [Bacillota bacterium]